MMISVKNVSIYFVFKQIYYNYIAHLALSVVYYRLLQAYLMPITEKKSRNVARNGIVGYLGHSTYPE